MYNKINKLTDYYMQEAPNTPENQKELAIKYLRLNEEATELRRQITSNLEQLEKVRAEGNEAQFGESYKKDHTELSEELDDLQDQMRNIRAHIDEQTADEYLKMKTITKIDAEGNESQHQINALDENY